MYFLTNAMSCIDRSDIHQSSFLVRQFEIMFNYVLKDFYLTLVITEIKLSKKMFAFREICSHRFNTYFYHYFNVYK